MSYDLSVIIPSFNKADHLRLNLASLANQTFAHDRFEALVVDDGSQDHTLRVVQEARQQYDYRLRYFYLNRPQPTSSALTWNYGIVRSEAPTIVQMGADIFAARDALELLHMYVSESDGNSQVFGRAYSVHSPLAQALLAHVPWQQDIHALEQLFITPYHHAEYWTVPLLAALPKAWFGRLRGYDESYDQPYPDDSDFWVRFEAAGGHAMNPPDVWGAHQFHLQQDVECPDGCPCPLSVTSRTHPGPTLKYGGTPEDLVRNGGSWGQFTDSYEA